MISSKFFGLLLCIAIGVYDIPNVYTQMQRIIGGLDAASGQFPYQVSLRSSPNYTHFCGGSIISSSWVLSAAHCVANEPVQTFSLRVLIVVGTNLLKEDGDSYDAVQFIVHDRFIKKNWANDITVIRSNREMTFTSLVLPIKLASVNPPDDSEVVLSGWGLTMYRPSERQPPFLQRIHLRMLSTNECRHRLHRYQKDLHDDDICTFKDVYQGACKGDSGGPLVDVRSGLQVGVVSWGVPCAVGRPDIFTSVVYHRSWIFLNTGV